LILIDTTLWVGDADSNDEFYTPSHAMLESVRMGTSPLGLVADFIIDDDSDFDEVKGVRRLTSP